MTESYGKLQQCLREAATLASVANLLGWDQETMMPPKSAGARAEELGLVSRLAHERATDPRIGELLADCESDPTLADNELESANLREIRRDYDRALKLPAELVSEMTSTNSKCIEVWKSARTSGRFADFAPWLEKQIELNRRKAECYGPPEGGELYDALVEDFEPGMTGAEIERIFGPLRDELTPLIAEIRESGRQPDGTPHEIEIPVEHQRELSSFVLDQIGFDSEAGRLDVSVHPFSSGIGPNDTRITTRYHSNRFADALSATLHEAGHGLYEQGLPKEQRWGQPLAQPLGLGVHESQSRMWENHVGRSRPFWSWVTPLIREKLGPSLERYSAEDLYRAVNIVRPHLIRIESDEATYNLHIMLRFDLERAMLRGDLAPADLPAAWNERIRADLGLEVPDDARGCLQDIHWSMGAIGYFPTYTLGNLYAAQLWEQIRSELPELDAAIAGGRFDQLLGWLRANVHASSRSVPTDELCRKLTGRELGHKPLIRHLKGKFREIYGLA